MSFDIALSGIHAINAQLDEISNNIANSGTYGFKSSRVNFGSMMAGDEATGAQVESTTQSIGTDGGVVTTGGAMDAAIQGRGFFVSRDTSGATMYSRVGLFSVDKDGYVVDGSNRRAQGFAVVPGSSTLGAMGDLQVPTGQIPAQATDSMTYVGNLSSDWVAPVVTPFDHTDPQSFNGSNVSVLYDSLGAQHSMTQYFVRTGGSQVTVHYTLDGVDAPTTTTLDFGINGQLTAVNGAAPAAAGIALGTPAGAAALAVKVDYTGTTEFAGAANTTTNRSNGYASGTFTGVSIADDGSVMATYTNGQKQSIGTLALATFPDENKLVAVSDTSWTTSNASGAPLYFSPGTGMAGHLTTGALEQSNVDITSELVNLMTSQRNYQANSKVISTESAMLQSLMQAV
jgi:flagellar hook protein FlgE